MTMKSIADQLKQLGVDHPDNGFVSAYTRSLSEQDKKRLRSEFRRVCKIQANNTCQLTGSKIALVASHIKPFDHCANEFEATSYINGLLLRRDIDYLFDKGYISFDENRRLMISSKITDPLGKQWVNQMHIAIGVDAMKAWTTGGDRCKIKAIRIPPKPEKPSKEQHKQYKQMVLACAKRSRHEISKTKILSYDYYYNSLQSVKIYREKLKQAHQRKEFMDYHRRHVFKLPVIQG